VVGVVAPGAAVVGVPPGAASGETITVASLRRAMEEASLV